jgi:hypothetical protein
MHVSPGYGAQTLLQWARCHVSTSGCDSSGGESTCCAAAASAAPALVACVQEKTVMRQVALPREVYTGSSNQLFDFLAQALADFIQEQEKVKLISIVNADARNCSETCRH